jgi:hypothetical protein
MSVAGEMTTSDALLATILPDLQHRHWQKPTRLPRH